MPVKYRYASLFLLKSLSWILNMIDANEIEMIALKGGEKMNPLIGNTYRLGFLDGLGGKNIISVSAPQAAAQTNGYHVARPRDGFLLSESMGDVLQNIQSLHLAGRVLTA